MLALRSITAVTCGPACGVQTEYQRRPDRRAGDPPPVTFTCQHGAEECWGNKVHACGIRQAESQTQAVDFATCLMKRYRKLRFIAGEVSLAAERKHISWVCSGWCMIMQDDGM